MKLKSLMMGALLLSGTLSAGAQENCIRVVDVDATAARQQVMWHDASGTEHPLSVKQIAGAYADDALTYHQIPLFSECDKEHAFKQTDEYKQLETATCEAKSALSEALYTYLVPLNYDKKTGMLCFKQEHFASVTPVVPGCFVRGQLCLEVTNARNLHCMLQTQTDSLSGQPLSQNLEIVVASKAIRKQLRRVKHPALQFVFRLDRPITVRQQEGYEDFLRTHLEGLYVVDARNMEKILYLCTRK